MMTRNVIDTSKVLLGGTKEDVCCFIAALVEYQLLYNVNVEYENFQIKNGHSTLTEISRRLNLNGYKTRHVCLFTPEGVRRLTK
jgi:hypothetical protein